MPDRPPAKPDEPPMTGFERILIQAASMTLATIVTKVLCEGGGRVINWMGKTLDERTEKLIKDASQQYVQNFTGRHGILKVLGMREPVSLESIYTTVQFLDRSGISWFDSIESLERAYRQTGKRGFQPKNAIRRDGLRVANEKQFLMVLGGPGAGKSTFIRKIGLEALKGEDGDYEHECIPVLIELKNFTKEANLEEAIAQEFRICNMPHPDDTTAKLLEQGKLLILLDGLDEVPMKNTDEAIHQIQNFVDQYDKNRFIASCRVAAYRHNFRRFTDVAMADFDQHQIHQFIRNWFSSEADQAVGTAQRCWTLLHKPENMAAKELAHTPLLLTLLCLVYDRSQNFPTNRSSLYRKALRVLLEEWAAEKRIMREQIYDGMNTELEEILLSEIAYIAFEADRLFFSQREIVDQIRDFLTNNLNAPKHLNGEAVLNAIAIQQGILVERAEDVYSFSHLTLQEYLTAYYIDDHYLIDELVQHHLTNERWQEVFLLVAGLMRGGTDRLLLAMEAQTRTYINTPKLEALLEWAHEITCNSPGTLQPCAKRTTAVFLALIRDRALHLAHALNPNLARTLDLARTLTHARVPEFTHTLTHTPARAAAPPRAFARAMTQTFVEQLEKLQVFNDVNFNVLIARLEALKAKAPDIRQPEHAHQDFHSRIVQTWFTALRLNPSWISLSDTELQSLEHYLYANWLMVRCKQAAVRVSPQTWGAIEDRMLRLHRASD
ncbi:NACHT domain-containing protein [Pantanalinema sp. GBBB05]|uniref:NACHT domain-containing protein n=1 Tax=Pantanalinema sp. GBBB05 TaxID=2604139 RepID=UPI003D81A7FA